MADGKRGSKPTENPAVNPDPTPGPGPTPTPTPGRRYVERPEGGMAAAEAAAEAVATAQTAAFNASGITPSLLAAQQRLHRGVADQISSQTALGPAGPHNVVGSFIGEKWTNGKPTGNLAVVVMVRTKFGDEDVPDEAALPQSVAGDGHGDELVDVWEVGDVIPYYRNRETPARYGASIGLQNIPATGTLGCLVRMAADDKLCILSNNHVMANVNRAALNAAIIQPGNADPAGPAGRAVIANLLNYVTMQVSNFPQSAPFNRVDAAVAWTAFSACTPKFHTPGINFDPNPRFPTLQMPVIKEGRTTDFTRGTVVGLNATVSPVSYGPPQFPGGPGTAPFAGFTGQVVVAGQFGLAFSQPGDSGSLICGLTSDGAYHPVALLFSGGVDQSGQFGQPGRQVTFGNPIQDVMQALGIAEILGPTSI